MKREIFSSPDGSCMNYGVFFPASLDKSGHELPLIVYLHGAGERGRCFEHVYRHALAQMLDEGAELEAVVLIPQCQAALVWDNVVTELKALIDRTVMDYGVRRDRICLTGSSMGGFGTWMMGMTYPDYFAAIAPVAGGGMAWRAPKLRTTPVFAWHGAADKVVIPEYSRIMAVAVNAAGGRADLTLLRDKGHNDGIDCAYAHTDLLEKLLRARRTDFRPVPEICEEMF